ncbi:MAG TPA: hypothetical protein ENK98_03520 [Epsilonproteobacteria bacterium]|nr:hypothetical protein [Campylobacterota bacterium]
MLKGMTSILVLFLLSACTSKEEKALMHVYEKNKIYHQKLEKTEKIQLKENGITKLVLTGTYLYKPSKKKIDKRDEVFIISIYAEDSDVQSITQEGYSLTLEGKSAKEIKLLSKDDPHLKDISFVSDWSQFYLVHFPHTAKKSFKLIFKSDTYGKGILHFAKVAKYVLHKDSIF